MRLSTATSNFSQLQQPTRPSLPPNPLTPIESFLQFLISRNILDNQSDDSETLSKYLTLFDQFETQLNESTSQDDSQLAFETKAIFSLADFLKSLQSNEYYDIAQKLFNEWHESEYKNPIKKLERVVQIRVRKDQFKIMRCFNEWKTFKMFADLIDQNDQMHAYIEQLNREREQLIAQRNILELQTKKRNQSSSNRIQSLRQSRRDSFDRQDSHQENHRASLRSRSRSGAPPVPMPMTITMSTIDQNQYTLPPYSSMTDLPIHERLHKEAYFKQQKQVVNDVRKHQDELRKCTFKPNATGSTPLNRTSQTGRREDPFIYERLSKSQRKLDPEIVQIQKEEEELQACTFKPQTNKKSHEILQKSSDQYREDKNQFFERLYKEGETKQKYKQTLQLFKDQVDMNGCTFQPETNRSSVRDMSDSDTFSRLHQEREEKQRNQIKLENKYDQKFKENYTFQPVRVTKSKDRKFIGDTKETSQQRVARLYEQWKGREQKIEEKRRELQEEEEKMHKLFATRQSKPNRQSMDQSASDSMAESHIDRLYNIGKEKQRKQEELRQKLFKEQGYSFAPQTNQNPQFKETVESKSVIERNQEFLQRKQSHIKELEEETRCDFKPQRVTARSKLSMQYQQNDENNENLGEKLYQRGQQIEMKKEKLRQENSVDRNCTFKPQLAKKTESILKNSARGSHSGSIVNGSFSGKHNSNAVNIEVRKEGGAFNNVTNLNQ